MIMKVACFFDQHSPMLGQPASSQTVTRPLSRTISWVGVEHAEPGALTLIQSGLRSSGVDGPVGLLRVARPSVSRSVTNEGPFRPSTSSRRDR